MMTQRWGVAVVTAAALALVGGCGSSGSSKTSPTTASPTNSSSAGATTTSTASSTGVVDVASGEIPASPVTATLDQTYGAKGAAFDIATFGVSAGSVTAAWYRVDDVWAVHYRGLDQQHAVGKCPGNSIKTAAGFEHVSNSPYGALACKVFTGTVLPPGSLRLCGGKAVLYTTQIPTSAVGTLYGSLEQGLGDGLIQGITSHVAADASAAPAIDVRGCAVIS